MFKLKLLAIFTLAAQLAACGAAPAAVAPVAVPPPTEVTAKTVAELARLPATVRYSGTVAPEQEIQIFASVGGTVTAADFTLGKTVAAGELLVKIDDADAVGRGGSGLTGSGAAAANVAVSQSDAALALAEKNLASVRAAAADELAAAQTNAGQATRGAGQTITTTAENLKSAELAVQAAQLAREQAELSLKNREQTAAESTANVNDTAQLTARTQLDLTGTVRDGLAVLTGFDEQKTAAVSYDHYLGALDSNAKNTAKNSFGAFSRTREMALANTCDAAADCLARTATVVIAAQAAVNATLILLEKSVTAADFSTTQLAALKATVTGYQTQLSVADSALTAARQQLHNTSLANTTALDSLKQSLEIAQKAEASVQQNLTTLQASTIATRDSASSGASTATSNLAALQARQKAAIAAAEAQLAQARLARENAILNRDSFTKNRLITAPVAGVIVKKAVAVGDNVAPGALLFTLNPASKSKVDVFVDGDTHALLAVGERVTIVLPGGDTAPAKIVARAATADPVTRRFQLEIVSSGSNVLPPVGSVVGVDLAVTYRVQAAAHALVPAAVLTVGQNETTLFAIKAGKAMRATVTTVRVLGAAVEVVLPADFSNDSLIITSRAELADGQAVSMSK